ncbi:hypothetical protein ACLSZY_05725 [Avibacterium volantium]|uniref:hypothetical protein n=1 Tax=Avibacterium TaxID=292486 RepID=UPI0039FDBAB2
MLEPELFFTVTGLTQKDFQLLVNLNVFNQSQMNEAVFSFKRYEDASLEYTGIRKHQGDLWAATTPSSAKRNMII